MVDRSIWIGWDPREVQGYLVTRYSIRTRLTQPIPIKPIMLKKLAEIGLYRRPTEVRTIRNFFTGRETTQLWDVLSGAPMSTQFACSRFFVPLLAKTGKALFMDCDMMATVNLTEIFEYVDADPGKAVYCVKHDHKPVRSVKMDNQTQTQYLRKNWSSVMVFDCDHPSNQKLTPKILNSWPGRDLHAFKWLEDDEIGELPISYNYLVGYTRLPEDETPAIVHWTEGSPFMPGYEQAEYADEFWQEIERWAA